MTSEPWFGYSKVMSASEMALFSMCAGSRAQKVLDTAAILRQAFEPNRIFPLLGERPVRSFSLVPKYVGTVKESVSVTVP
jgi:hypothetical protein